MERHVMQLFEQRSTELHQLIASGAEKTEHGQRYAEIISDRCSSVQRCTAQSNRTCPLQHIARMFTWGQHKLGLETLRELVHITLVGSLVADRWS